MALSDLVGAIAVFASLGSILVSFLASLVLPISTSCLSSLAWGDFSACLPSLLLSLVAAFGHLAFSSLLVPDLTLFGNLADFLVSVCFASAFFFCCPFWAQLWLPWGFALVGRFGAGFCGFGFWLGVFGGYFLHLGRSLALRGFALARLALPAFLAASSVVGLESDSAFWLRLYLQTCRTTCSWRSGSWLVLLDGLEALEVRRCGRCFVALGRTLGELGLRLFLLGCCFFLMRGNFRSRSSMLGFFAFGGCFSRFWTPAWFCSLQPCSARMQLWAWWSGRRRGCRGASLRSKGAAPGIGERLLLRRSG